jgi:hypothetical protein
MLPYGTAGATTLFNIAKPPFHLVPYCREAAIKNENFGLWAAETAHVSTLLPRSGNKKRGFGLWAAETAHVGTLLPRSGNKKQELGLWTAWAAHVGRTCEINYPKQPDSSAQAAPPAYMT